MHPASQRVFASTAAAPLAMTGLALLGATTPVHAQMTFTTQTRSATAATSFNANSVIQSAADFGPFSVVAEPPVVNVPAAGGGTIPNRGRSEISCTLDPNAIIATGSLLGSGGIAVTGAPFTGEAEALVLVAFTIAVPTPFQLLASPRPSALPGDEFELELENLTTTTQLFFLDETSPAQSVNFQGILQPGTYQLQYQVELTSDGPEQSAGYLMQFLVPSPGAAALLGLGALVGARRRRG